MPRRSPFFWGLLCLSWFIFSIGRAVDFPQAVYVSMESGDDANSGSDWANAKKTLQAGIDAAPPDATVLVAPGVYAPIHSDNKAILIQSLNGPLFTIIDGQNRERCARLAKKPSDRDTRLIGFSLIEGNAVNSEQDAIDREGSGGGALGGTLEQCLIKSCVATRGGGAHDAALVRTVLAGNEAEYAGGASNSDLAFCLVAGNLAYKDEAGGASLSNLINCTVSDNSGTETGGLWNGGARHCLIQRNTIGERVPSNVRDVAVLDSIVEPDKDEHYETIPQFRDAVMANYRLVNVSAAIVAGAWHDDGAVDLDGIVIPAGAPVIAGAYASNADSAPLRIPSGAIAFAGTSVGYFDFMDEARAALLAGIRHNPDFSADMLDVFLNAGIGVGWRSPDGHPFLIEATAACGNPEVIARILAEGVGINGTGLFGMTPFLAAAGHNTNPAVIELLIQHGANVDAVDDHGGNALAHAAAFNPNPEVIPLLAKAGVDPNRLDATGKTPIMYAMERPADADRAVAMLMEWGARPPVEEANTPVVGGD